MLTQMKVKSVQIQENSPVDLTATPCEYASLECDTEPLTTTSFIC